jgi:DUF2934 family protein
MQNWEEIKEHRSAVEKRAYEIYLQRGARDGNDLEDWLTAEREISARAAREPLSPELTRAKAASATRTVGNSR